MDLPLAPPPRRDGPRPPRRAPDAVDPLIETLWSRDENEQLDAIRALGQLGDGAATEALMAVFPTTTCATGWCWRSGRCATRG